MQEKIKLTLTLTLLLTLTLNPQSTKLQSEINWISYVLLSRCTKWNQAYPEYSGDRSYVSRVSSL